MCIYSYSTTKKMELFEIGKIVKKITINISIKLHNTGLFFLSQFFSFPSLLFTLQQQQQQKWR